MRFSVFHHNRVFMASGSTGTAAVAFFLINMNNPAFHSDLPFHEWLLTLLWRFSAGLDFLDLFYYT